MRFGTGSGTDLGQIFDDLGRSLEAHFSLGCGRASKLCLDCTGMSGLHVRPSTEAPLSVSHGMFVWGLRRNDVWSGILQVLGSLGESFW